MYDENYLMHYGVSVDDGAPGVGSGRYPKGSGENPYQHDGRFLTAYREMKKQGLTDEDIIKAYNINLPKNQQINHQLLRQIKSIDIDKEKNDRLIAIEHMKKHGDSNVAIANKLGVTEGTVRNILKNAENIRNSELRATADIIKKNVDERGYIDVGKGVEHYIDAAKKMGISSTRLSTAVQMLKEEGYEVFSNIRVEQVTNKGKYTTMKVICPPGTQWADVQKNIDKIKPIQEFSPDKGSTYRKLEYPQSISSDRIMVKYGDEGGISKDGVIEIRPGVPDLSLGKSHYAQVRIAVDNTHYLKGMAIYSDNIPPGVDIVFNTNKTKYKDDGSLREKKEVLKPFEKIKIGMNPDNPFGATIMPNGQYTYTDKDGKEKLGAINKIKEEGDWNEYSRNLASQFLSKQSEPLVRRQLEISIKDKVAEFEDIKNVKNPAIKKYLLEEFASGCDRAAVDLKAAALPGQSSKVILPIDSLKSDEIYAPTYKSGTRVALVRYPHGGLFEIPILTVNNENRKARQTLGNPIDAVGINSKVAEQLSGADFDGDTVVVIPLSKKVQIQSMPPLKELVGFDPKLQYKMSDEDVKAGKVIKHQTMQTEMGKVSNLISDMTLKGAPFDEVARAVKHSMVVIDSEKHELDYKRSFQENRIADLKTKWQGAPNAGASTLISQAKSQYYDDERAELRPSDIDPKTGKITRRYTGRTYTDPKTGKEVKAQFETTKMEMTDDARTLLSDNPNPKEIAYAEYANGMKALANEARKEQLATKNQPPSDSAKKIYANEVDSLSNKLTVALRNAPKERQAQIIATCQYRAAKESNPEMTKEDQKRLKDQLLAKARISLGAGKKDVRVVPTEKEWEAIDSNALTNTKLTSILRNMDSEDLKKHMFKNNSKSISDSQIARIKALAGTYTIKEIAEYTGFSVSTVSKALKGE